MLTPHMMATTVLLNFEYIFSIQGALDDMNRIHSGGHDSLMDKFHRQRQMQSTQRRQFPRVLIYLQQRIRHCICLAACCCVVDSSACLFCLDRLLTLWRCVFITSFRYQLAKVLTDTG